METETAAKTFDNKPIYTADINQKLKHKPCEQLAESVSELHASTPTYH